MRQAIPWLVGAAVMAADLGTSLSPGKPAGAQGLEPPAGCLGDYGSTGCAALIYSQMVCDPGQAATPASVLDQQLAAAFQAAGLAVNELQVDGVVNTALNRFIPSLCPDQLIRLQKLRR